MYKDDILNLIEQSPLEIDTEIQMSGRPPTMASSEFLTNKEQGDWAEKLSLRQSMNVLVIILLLNMGVPNQ